ncbi:MAG: hypothetical protein IPG47_08820 [Thermoflexaceae bacterium]|nr:hypothetical protein [Thermoflexaceae bacterium]
MSPWTPTLGAIASDDGVRFRVWAPEADVTLLLYQGDGQRRIALERDGEYHRAFVPGAGAGTRYAYDAGGTVAPDPCSRSQPDGVHGPSEVVDPRAFAWTDAGCRPAPFADLVLYECHIGTFTGEGTFDAAIEKLPYLVHLGVNAIEVMPVASFPGGRNWGYDGVSLFAPAAPYGGPEAFRRFIDAAHAAGVAVILDVVYNHLGPDGNYLGLFSPRYTTPRHKTPWGDALNFDDRGSESVRGFFTENLLHWIHEYHIDGFRLDATHEIADDSRATSLAHSKTPPWRTRAAGTSPTSRPRRTKTIADTSCHAPKGSGSMPFGPTTSITACAPSSTRNARGTSAGSRGPPPSSLARSGKAGSTKGNALRVRTRRGAPRRTGSHGRRSCTASRTTTRSATGRWGCGSTPRPVSAISPPRRRSCCCCPRPRSCSRARSSRPRRRFSTSPSTSRGWDGWLPKGGDRSSRRSRRSATRRFATSSLIRRPPPLSSIQGCPGPRRNGARAASCVGCTASCFACVRRIPCWSRHGEAARR